MKIIRLSGAGFRSASRRWCDRRDVGSLEVEPSVRNEWMLFRRRELDEAFYARLREGYEIAVEASPEAE